MEKEIVLNPVLQRLAYTPLKLIIIVYSIIVSCFLYLDLQEHTVLEVFKQILLGLAIWTLVEYLVHRFVFHGTTKNLKIRTFRYFMHGYHHDKPTDPKRLVLPIVITLPITILNFVVVYQLFGVHGTAVVAGFTLGYIIYDITHYAIHRYHPTSRFGKFLKRYHFHHHFKNSEQYFGVTSPIWDYPFKTH